LAEEGKEENYSDDDDDGDFQWVRSSYLTPSLQPSVFVPADPSPLSAAHIPPSTQTRPSSGLNPENSCEVGNGNLNIIISIHAVPLQSDSIYCKGHTSNPQHVFMQRCKID
jgi:hypothetical protein